MTIIPTLNYGQFLRQLDRFRKMVLAEDGREFSSFTSGLAYRHEHFKEVVYHEARSRLAWSDWKEAQVGTGEILRSVIDAIEIKQSNLVDWDLRRGPDGRSHHRLCVALESKSQLVAWESLFFDFYRAELTAEEAFQPLVDLVGKRYDLIAYLYYLTDWSGFAPIAPDSFDKAFVMLGVELKTSRKCSWENYQAFLGVLRQVRDALRIECYDDVRLIDAHSFCWMIAQKQLPDEGAEAPASVPEPFSGELLFVPKSAPTESGGRPGRAPVDWESLRRKQAEVGRLAEAVALNSEKLRLEGEGRADLVPDVRLVSDDHTLGYDLKSFNADGSDRHIEVKAARIESGVTLFFLSENERLKSRELDSYFFYLVFDARGSKRVKWLPAGNLGPELLSPVTHQARFAEALPST